MHVYLRMCVCIKECIRRQKNRKESKVFLPVMQPRVARRLWNTLPDGETRSFIFQGRDIGLGLWMVLKKQSFRLQSQCVHRSIFLPVQRYMVDNANLNIRPIMAHVLSCIGRDSTSNLRYHISYNVNSCMWILCSVKSFITSAFMLSRCENNVPGQPLPCLAVIGDGTHVQVKIQNIIPLTLQGFSLSIVVMLCVKYTQHFRSVNAFFVCVCT